MGVEPAGDASHHRHDDGRRARAHEKSEDELEREKRCNLGRQSHADRQADRARHDNSAGAEAIGEAAPGHAAERHGEEADRHGARHASHGPAGVPSNGLQQNGQREHGSDRNAAQKAARRDDHPSVARFDHTVPYQLVGTKVKGRSRAEQ
jgi:hypothetical protein